MWDAIKLSAAVLFLGLGACGGEPPLPTNIRGITHIDSGTDYVFVKEQSSIGGACRGWNSVLIARRGDRYTGRSWEICWREENGTLTINTEAGDRPHGAPIETMLDIRGTP